MGVGLPFGRTFGLEKYKPTQVCDRIQPNEELVLKDVGKSCSVDIPNPGIRI